MAFRPWRHASTKVSMTSSTVESSGRFTVLEMAPEMKGCTAPIILTWPSQWIVRSPFCARNAQSNTGRGLVVSESAQGAGGRVVDDLHQAAADQGLVLDQGDVRLDPRGVAVHHEPDGARRREHSRLGVAIT